MKYSNVHANLVPPIQSPLRKKGNTKASLASGEHQAADGDSGGKLSEEELLLTPPFVYGFSLEKKIWGKPSN